MADPSGNRLTALTDDNHQPWLWFVQIFTCCCVAGAGGLRFWIKRKHLGNSDIILLVAHVLYLPYWIIMLFALINDLGKSDKLASPANEVKASKLLFSSRILLVLLINLAKLATVFLIQEIFTKDVTKWWFRAISLLVILETLVGSLMISAGCSPSHVLLSGDKSQCSGNSARWIVFTIFETAMELLLVIPVLMIVSVLQTNVKNKLFTISAFASRLVIWAPAIMHLAFFITFIRNGPDNIGIVPTVAMEELWVALALISASTPALMRIAKRFTTTGVTVATVNGTSGSESRTKTKEVSHRLANLNKRRASAKNSKMDSSDGPVLRPDQGIYSISIDAIKKGNEAGSIGSTAESHTGILRQVEYDVSYESKGP